MPGTRTVLILSHTAQLGGAELALVRLFGALDPARFRVRILLFADGPLRDRLRAAGAEVAVLPLAPAVAEADRRELRGPGVLRSAFVSARFTLRLTRAIRHSGAELVVANTLKTAVFASCASPLSGRRWVWHLHDRLADDYLSPRTARLLRTLARRGPRAVVANSRATLETLRGLPGGRAHVAYPGLEPSSPVAAHGLQENPPRIGILGRISPTKGQREFLTAAHDALPELGDVRLRIIGTALFNERAYQESLPRLAADLGIADRVEFSGWADDPAAELRRLALLVHASPVPEPFGQVVAEAMSAGVPVIASDAGGVSEILSDDSGSTELAPGVRRTAYGVLTRPGDTRALADALRWVAAHPKDVATMASAARTRAASRFTIEQTATTVQEAWSQAIKR